MKRDAERIKNAANGRWLDVLSSVGSIPRELLDGQHHPCPKCGGDDRFRLIDAVAGAVLCNQCFNTKNGDGFAAIMWLTGCKFTEAVDRVADFLGMKPEKSDKDPGKDLDWREWSSELAQFFVVKNPGVSEAAILAAGGRMARYKRTSTVIAFPIIGESLEVEKPVGWVIVNAMGGTLPKFAKGTGEIIGQVKHKTTYGSGTGFVGVHAIERIKRQGVVEVCWKIEGLTDLLAVIAAVPESLADRHVAVTNAHGTQQDPVWMASMLAQVQCNVLHDCDEPGQAGANKWTQAIATQGGTPRLVVLPYEIKKDHGQDVRDWLNESNNYADLLALAERSQVIEIKKTASGEVDYASAKYPIQELILQKLQIEVLYETEDGRVRIFSWLLRKSSWIGAGQVDRLKKERLIQICGPTAMEHISSDPDNQSTWSIVDVRTAIALMASSRREEHNERGVGVWQGRDDTGREVDAIMLVGNTEAAKWNGTGELGRIVSPRSDGLVLDFGSNNRDWFEFADLQRWMLEARDPAWCSKVIDETVELFGRWRWRNQKNDPALITGLVLATWVQTLWTWRPLVVVIGESNSGKSLLFEALGGSDWRRGLFGALAFKQAKSTEAGIRQGVGNTARVVLCDEFEQSRERDKVLEMLRASTRGETISRGTTDQRGRTFTLRHIGWVAAIEAGLQRQPDVNRFIQFELLTALKGSQGKLQLPENGYLYRLGQKLLGIAVTHVFEAKKLAAQLKGEEFSGVDARTVEVYAVPAAMLAKSMGLDGNAAKMLLADLLSSVEPQSQGSTDHEDLLNEILGGLINCGAKDGNLSVGQILDSQSLWMEHAGRVEAHGISKDVVDESGTERILIAHKTVATKLLKGSSWERQRIDQVLLRIPGAVRRHVRIGGLRPRSVSIPMAIQVSEF